MIGIDYATGIFQRCFPAEVYLSGGFYEEK